MNINTLEDAVKAEIRRMAHAHKAIHVDDIALQELAQEMIEHLAQEIVSLLLTKQKLEFVIKQPIKKFMSSNKE